MNVATASGAPVSTTHSIIGAVLGAGIAAGGTEAANWGTLTGIVALFAVAMVLGTRQSTGDGETFIGTDSAATTHIEENQLATPRGSRRSSSPSSGEVESGLFALQAALGAGAPGSSSARCASGVASAGRLPTIRAAR